MLAIKTTVAFGCRLYLAITPLNFVLSSRT